MLESRFIKPRVFLSHSKADVGFISRIFNDLPKCQIDPWMDEIEIRTGRPWLDAIFEDGIPTCDSVFVYLTKQSVESNIVKKEMDAGMLQQLRDRHVAFLPYVEDEGLRASLRLDIQALQVPVWSSANYDSVFPRFVSEVWRSFFERTLHSAVQEEQNRRLTAELALEKLKGTSGEVFSSAEEADFKHIWQTFNVMIPLVILEKTEAREEGISAEKKWVERSFRLKLNLGSLVAQLPSVNSAEYQDWSAGELIKEEAKKLLTKDKSGEQERRQYYLDEIKILKSNLLLFGLIETTYIQRTETANTKIALMMRGSNYKHLYTNKMFRFLYWLAYNQQSPKAVEFDSAIEVVVSEMVN